MKWMLDTNTCIRYLSGRAPALQHRLDATRRAEVGICAIVKAELFFGSARSHDPIKSRAIQLRLISAVVSLPFDDRCAETYAAIRSTLAMSGKPIGPNDLLIAAIAITNDVTLVTHNTGEFSRVGGLRYEGWEA